MEKVLIVGGTHGNESSGLMLTHPLIQQQLFEKYSQIILDFDIGNPLAVANNVRFTQDDLNRQFSTTILDSALGENAPYESTRAFEFNQSWGPKGNSETDLIIDIHNTTSAMGATLIILELDDFHIGLARYVKQQMPVANILIEDEKPPSAHPYLCTVGKRGVMVEVGAQPQGVYRADIALLAMQMTEHILAYCLMYKNEGNIASKLPKTDAFRLIDIVNYPNSSNNEQREWMIHPQLQDKDFSLMKSGDPAFLSFAGETKYWEGDPTYPHFINEAAYHKLNIAFATASKTEI